MGIKILQTSPLGQRSQKGNSYPLEILKGCKVEPSLAEARPGEFFQFLRQGYFCVDPDSTESLPVFNRSVTLRDSWAKIEKSQREKKPPNRLRATEVS